MNPDGSCQVLAEEAISLKDIDLEVCLLLLQAVTVITNHWIILVFKEKFLKNRTS